MWKIQRVMRDILVGDEVESRMVLVPDTCFHPCILQCSVHSRVVYSFGLKAFHH